jgi:hypothetical protein
MIVMAHNVRAGFAAILLAVLFPIFWLGGLVFSGQSLEDMYRANVMRLDGWDALFVVIGALEIYAYLALRERLKDFTYGSLSRAVLLLMALIVAVFHATVLFDVVIAFGVTAETADNLVWASGISAIAMLFVYTVLGYILALGLLLRFAELPKLLSLFAILLLVACVFQTTIFFGFVNTVLFPVILLVLAAYFMRGDHQVEVV